MNEIVKINHTDYGLQEEKARFEDYLTRCAIHQVEVRRIVKRIELLKLTISNLTNVYLLKKKSEPVGIDGIKKTLSKSTEYIKTIDRPILEDLNV